MRGPILFAVICLIIAGSVTLGAQHMVTFPEVTDVDNSEAGVITEVSYDLEEFRVDFEGSQVRAINLIGPNGELIGQKEIVLGQQSVSFFIDELGDKSGEYTIVAEGDDRDLLGRVVVELSEV